MANIQIDITQNGTTTLATEGCYCDSDVDVNVNVPDRYAEGRQAEYDAFWDVFQNNGNPTNYYYKFSYAGWTDENFNPKYPIVCAAGTTAGMALFYANNVITDTKVPIVVQGSSVQAMFTNAVALTTIRKLTVHKNVTFQHTFTLCNALENITFEGVIGTEISLPNSPKLSKASMESVFAALSDTTSGLTVTLSQTAKQNAFTDEEWAVLIATKPNWTISLV